MNSFESNFTFHVKSIQKHIFSRNTWNENSAWNTIINILFFYLDEYLEILLVNLISWRWKWDKLCIAPIVSRVGIFLSSVNSHLAIRPWTIRECFGETLNYKNDFKGPLNFLPLFIHNFWRRYLNYLRMFGKGPKLWKCSNNEVPLNDTFS